MDADRALRRFFTAYFQLQGFTLTAVFALKEMFPAQLRQSTGIEIENPFPCHLAACLGLDNAACRGIENDVTASHILQAGHQRQILESGDKSTAIWHSYILATRQCGDRRQEKSHSEENDGHKQKINGGKNRPQEMF